MPKKKNKKHRLKVKKRRKRLEDKKNEDKRNRALQMKSTLMHQLLDED